MPCKGRWDGDLFLSLLPCHIEINSSSLPYTPARRLCPTTGPKAKDQDGHRRTPNFPHYKLFVSGVLSQEMNSDTRSASAFPTKYCLVNMRSGYKCWPFPIWCFILYPKERSFSRLELYSKAVVRHEHECVHVHSGATA